MKSRADLLVMLMITLIEVEGFWILPKPAFESENGFLWIMPGVFGATILLYVYGCLKKHGCYCLVRDIILNMKRYT